MPPLFRLTRVLSVSESTGSGSRRTNDAGPPLSNSMLGGSGESELKLDHVATGSCGDHRFVAAAVSNNCLVIRHARLLSSAERVSRQLVELESRYDEMGASAYAAASEHLRAEAAAAALSEGKPVVRVVPWLTERPQKRIVAMNFNEETAAQWLMCVTLDCSVVLVPVYYLLVRSGGAAAVAAAQASNAQQTEKRGWFNWRTSSATSSVNNLALTSETNNSDVADLVDGAGRSLTDLTILKADSRLVGGRSVVATDGLWWSASKGTDFGIVSTSNGSLLFFDLNKRRQETLTVRLRSAAVRLSLVGPAHGQTHLLALTDRNQVFKLLLEYDDTDTDGRTIWCSIVDAHMRVLENAEGMDWPDLASAAPGAVVPPNHPMHMFQPQLLEAMNSANIDLQVKTDGAAGDDWVVMKSSMRQSPASGSEGIVGPHTLPGERPAVKGPLVSRFFQKKEQVVGVYYSPVISKTTGGGDVSVSQEHQTRHHFGGLLQVYDAAEIRDIPMYEYALPSHFHVNNGKNERRAATISGVHMTDKFVFGVDPGNARQAARVHIMSKHLLGRSWSAHNNRESEQSDDMHSRTGAILQTLKLPRGAEVRGILPSLSISDSAESNLLHDPSDVPAGCVVWTSGGDIFEVRPVPSAGQRLFSQLVSSGQDAAAEPLGKTLGLDVLRLYELAADGCFSAGDYGRALSLYFLSNVRTEKLVSKFACIRRVDAVISFCRTTLDSATVRFTMAQKRNIANILFCSHLFLLANAQADRLDDNSGQLSAERSRLISFCQTNFEFDIEEATSMILQTYIDVAHAREGSNRSSARRFCPQSFDMLTLAVEIMVRATHAREVHAAKRLRASSSSPVSPPAADASTPEHMMLRPMFDQVLATFAEHGRIFQLTGDQLSWTLQWSLAENTDVLSHRGTTGSKLAGLLKWFRGALWRRSLLLFFRSAVPLPLSSEALSAALVEDQDSIRDLSASLAGFQCAAMPAAGAKVLDVTQQRNFDLLRWLASSTFVAGAGAESSEAKAFHSQTALLVFHVRVLLSVARVMCALDESVDIPGLNFGPNNLAECQRMLAMALLRTLDLSGAYEPISALLMRTGEARRDSRYPRLCAELAARLHDIHGGFVAALLCRWQTCTHANDSHEPDVDGRPSSWCILASFASTLPLPSIAANKRAEATEELLLELFDIWHGHYEDSTDKIGELESFLLEICTDGNRESFLTTALCNLARQEFEVPVPVLSQLSSEFWMQVVELYETISLDSRSSSASFVDTERNSRLWGSIVKNSMKNTHGRAYVSVSTVSLESKHLDLGATNQSTPGDRVLIFSCGHRHSASDFYDRVVPEFARTVSGSNRTDLLGSDGFDSSSDRTVLPLPSTAAMFVDMYRNLQHAPQPVACPACVLGWLRSESQSAIDVAVAEALK